MAQAASFQEQPGAGRGARLRPLLRLLAYVLVLPLAMLALGLWQAKARNVVELSRQLLERHAGQVPRERAALEALPGVGRKTANVVLNVAFGESTMAVDTHIFRLGNRTGLAPGKDVREVEEALLKRCPQEWLRDAHHWLILHGRYVCKARLPECWRCAAREFCNYRDKVLVPPQRSRTA